MDSEGKAEGMDTELPHSKGGKRCERGLILKCSGPNGERQESGVLRAWVSSDGCVWKSCAALASGALQGIPLRGGLGEGQWTRPKGGWKACRLKVLSFIPSSALQSSSACARSGLVLALEPYFRAGVEPLPESPSSATIGPEPGSPGGRPPP